MLVLNEATHCRDRGLGIGLRPNSSPFTGGVEGFKIAALQLLAPFGCPLVDAERESGVPVAGLFQLLVRGLDGGGEAGLHVPGRLSVVPPPAAVFDLRTVGVPVARFRSRQY